MKDLSTRLFTALIFGALFIFSLFFSWQTLVLVFGVLAMIALYEYRQIVDRITPMVEDKYDMWIFWINGLCVYLVTCWVGNGLLEWKYNYITAILILAPIVVKNWFLPQYTWKDALAYAWGYIWIVIPMAMATFFAFYKGDFDPRLILYILAIIWVHDILAYFVGKNFGNIKLMPSISPNKTVEGYVGGVLGALITALIISAIDPTFSRINWISIGLIVAIFATIGDLFESWLKRTAGVKDSGSILPGHGGVLDRFDAFLFCVPIILLTILFVFR